MQKVIIQRLKEAVKELKRKYPLRKMALFGSVLRDDFTEESDIDILIDFNSDDFLLFNALAEELEMITGRKVDLITSRSLKQRHYDYIKDRLLYV